jgi:Undecaprenyl-phosphate galactose phosphotransferase WbaP
VAAILASDALALSFTYWFAVLVRYLIDPGGYELGFYLQFYPMISLFVAAFATQDLYPGFLIHPAEEIRRVCHSVTFVFLLVGSATFLNRDAEAYSRSVFLMAWAFGMPAVLLSRVAVRSLLSKTEWWGIPAVILGSGKSAQRVLRTLGSHQSLGIRVIGMLDESAGGAPGVVGLLGMASDLSVRAKVPYAIVSMPEKSSAELNHIVQTYCQGFRHVLLVPDLIGAYSLGVKAKDIAGELGIEVPQQLFQPIPKVVKRSIDILGSALGLLFLTPLFACLAIAIKLTSSGPVFYGHVRKGWNGTLFKTWKFRSMVTNGDRVLEKYFTSHPGRKKQWDAARKLKDDPRVTRIGRLMRPASLDELPQLWNVLVGEMSLVGPRPMTPNEIAQDSFEMCTRVRPGITGLWQVSGRNNLSYPDRIRLNEYYIRNWSIWLDIFILARTVTTVLKTDGAY